MRDLGMVVFSQRIAPGYELAEVIQRERKNDAAKNETSQYITARGGYRENQNQQGDEYQKDAGRRLRGAGIGALISPPAVIQGIYPSKNRHRRKAQNSR